MATKTVSAKTVVNRKAVKAASNKIEEDKMNAKTSAKPAAAKTAQRTAKKVASKAQTAHLLKVKMNE